MDLYAPSMRSTTAWTLRMSLGAVVVAENLVASLRYQGPVF